MRFIKPIVFVVCLLPFFRGIWWVFSGEAINPVEFALHSSGTWALVALLITIALTPLRKLTGWQSLIRYRRMLGLFVFFYAVLHVLIWLVLDRELSVINMLKDIVKRPFITVGFFSFLILLFMAITSSNNWMRRLKRNWVRLHKGIYLAAPLGVLHYFFLVKKDLSQPIYFALVLSVLVVWRFYSVVSEYGRSKFR